MPSRVEYGVLPFLDHTIDLAFLVVLDFCHLGLDSPWHPFQTMNVDGTTGVIRQYRLGVILGSG